MYALIPPHRTAETYLAAIGGDRTVGIGTTASPTGPTWGTALFAPTNFGFGTAAGDGTVTFTSPIDAGAAARTIDVIDGPAALEGVMTGAYTGTSTLTKTGNGPCSSPAGGLPRATGTRTPPSPSAPGPTPAPPSPAST